MTPFEKGAEDVMDVLGIKPGIVTDIKEKVVENIPEPLVKLREEIGKSYRATPYSVLFGRYKDTLGDTVRDVKDKVTGLLG